MLKFYYLIFFFSGLAGLIYESVWAQYLKLFVGHSAYAQAFVLVLFMGGNFLGALLASKYTTRIKYLLLAYAILELFIGFFGISFHLIYTTSSSVMFSSVLPNINSEWLVVISQWVYAILLLALPTLMLGATFPCMSAGIIRMFPSAEGRPLGWLYATNATGGAIGLLISGFILLPKFGLPMTSVVAGVINIIVAVLVWFSIRRSFAEDYERNNFSLWVSNDAVTASDTAIPKDITFKKGILAAAFLTGAASFCYEIGWIRMLSLVLGSSTHSFELMLSSFILGLGIGSFLIRNKLKADFGSLKWLGVIQIIKGFAAISTLVLYNYLFEMMAKVMSGINKTETGYFFFNLASDSFAMIIMLPATIFAGMTLPLMTHALLQKRYGEASIGQVYAFNTVGSIFGTLAAIYLIMPYLSVHAVIGTGSFIDMILGAVMLTIAIAPIGQMWITFSALLIPSICGIMIYLSNPANPILMSSGVFRYGAITNANAELKYYRDGSTASVSVISYPQTNNLTILTNGKPDASISMGDNPTGDELTQILLGVIPLSVKPDAKDVAIIGFGSGTTTHVVLQDKSISKVDTIEIEPAIVEGAKLFSMSNFNAYNDPRSHIIIDDAKTYFITTHNQYDIIISEPSNPWVSGVASLFTKEFYAQVKNNLKEDGHFVQWMHLYEIDMPLLATVFNALSLEFKDYKVFVANESDIIIIAGDKEIGDVNKSIFDKPKIVRELKKISINNIDDLNFRYLAKKSDLQHFIQSYSSEINSDYYPILEYGAVKSRFLGQNSKELVALLYSFYPVLKWCAGYEQATKPVSLSRAFGSTAESDSMHYRANQILDNKIDMLDLNFRQQIESLKVGGYTCTPRLSVGHKTVNLRTVFMFLQPYLNSSTIKKVWTDINPSPCPMQTYDQVMYNTLEGMLKSFVNQDYPNVIASHKYIIDNKLAWPNAETYELVHALMMVAHYNLGNYELISNYYEKNINDNNSMQLFKLPLFRWILASVKQNQINSMRQ